METKNSSIRPNKLIRADGRPRRPGAAHTGGHVLTNTAPGSPVKRGKSKEQLIPQIFLFFQQGTAPRAVGPASGLSGHSASNWMRPRRPSCQELAVRPCAAVSGEIRVSDREAGTRRPFRACVSRPVGAKISLIRALIVADPALASCENRTRRPLHFTPCVSRTTENRGAG